MVELETDGLKGHDYLTESACATSKVMDNEKSAEDVEINTCRYVKVVFDHDSIKEYSYLDENRIAYYDCYVWVPVGKDNIEKPAFVVDMNEYTVDNVPYPLEKTKRILRLATDEDVEKIEANLL